LTVLSPPSSILSAASVPASEPIVLIPAGPYRLFAAWVDNRTGSGDVYAASLDLQGCP
jgi:hypothetical protein